MAAASKQGGISMSDSKLTLANPELKEALATLRLKSEENLEQRIYDMVANGARFLSVATPAEDSTPEAPKYEFPVLTTKGHGYLFYPIFTDMEELRKWKGNEDAQILILTFDNYAELLEQNSKVQGLVINPYGANFAIERDMVDYLKVQKAFIGKLAIEQMFHQEHDQPEIQLSDPEPYPAEMADALRRYMATNPIIRRAWLRLMDRAGEQSYLVIVDAAESDTHGDFGEISGAAMPYLTDMYLDLLTLDDPFAQKATEGVAPFYKQQ